MQALLCKQRQINTQQAAYQSAQSNANGSNDSFCYGIGERFGRAAARSMDGRDVKHTYFSNQAGEFEVVINIGKNSHVEID